MSVLATIYLLVTALCFLMAGVTALVSMAPGWRQERHLAGFFALAALFNLANALQGTGVSDGVIVWVTRSQFVLALTYLVFYPNYLHQLSLWEPRRWDKPILAATWLFGGTALIPGWLLTDVVVERHFNSWAVLREPTVGIGSNLFSLVLLGVMAWVTLQAALCWKKGRAGGAIHMATMGVLFLGSLHDLLVFEGVISFPYMVPIALMAMSALLGAHMLLRFTREAQRLDLLSRQLESQVEARSQDLVKVRDELEHSARVGALGHMVASVAHELNNPLSVIQGNLELLRNDCRQNPHGSEDALEALDDALAGSRRVAGVVADLLQAGRAALQGAEMMEPVPVVELLRETLLRLQREGVWRRSLQLEVLGQSDLYVRSNRKLLEQVLRKLLLYELSNLAEVQEVARLSISARQRGEEVELVLEDNSQGMNRQQAQALFEPARIGGHHRNGLGLAITRGIVQSLGGEIHAESELGFGTRLVLRLPGSAELGPKAGRGAPSVAPVVSSTEPQGPRPFQRLAHVHKPSLRPGE